MSATAEREMVTFQRLNLTETVVYRPASGDARSIVALVDRMEASNLMNVVVRAIRITVMNDSVLGIDPSIMNRGNDQIDVSERIGGKLETREIHQIIEQNEEFITIEVY